MLCRPIQTLRSPTRSQATRDGKTVRAVLCHLPLIALAVLPVSGWAQTKEAAIRNALRQELTDPDSAKFGKLTMVGRDKACLTVNSKNQLGGYTGHQQAYMYTEKGRWQVALIAPGSVEDCVAYQRLAPSR